jgi:hypothetical protein
MYAQHATAKIYMSPDSANSVLRGRWLAFAWIISGTLVVLALGLLVVAVPLRYIQLRTPPASIQAGLAQLGISAEFYAAYLVALSVLFAAGCFVVAIVIMWRKSKDVMALFVALMLVLLGTADMRNMEALTALHPAWEVLAPFKGRFFKQAQWPV